MSFKNDCPWATRISAKFPEMGITRLGNTCAKAVVGPDGDQFAGVMPLTFRVVPFTSPVTFAFFPASASNCFESPWST